jgi:hypothetical protein
MNFLEVLQAQGLSEKQISLITDAMLSNKIFITYEEKIEERFSKMKQQRDRQRARLELIEKALRS